ncbi:multicopper oxidase domain-containing protein [Mycolicibacterium austroafricanum]|uniref:Copper-containing nitrite reductase n=1 Tax=Mycolicibacterium austroafricanum TaxID=39687 RepID=A0ABT8HG72_MYCAO|nr:multicopper oxidase domain-containing protein [Mycolicibacterium austroafricanum]MDN4519765.1 multicopper oxidase domain-containing protein [Mycolicibacterium austroafricanum]
MSADLMTAQAPRRRNSLRGPVFLWANVVVLGWLAVSVGLLAAHSWLGLPGWVAMHALLLGAVTNAIVIWSEHFAVAWCRMPSPPQRRLALGLTALNLCVIAVLFGVSTDTAALTGIGGTGITVIAVVHTVHLRRATRATRAEGPGTFDYLIGFYGAAGVMLASGAVLGALLALGSGQWYVRLWSAHVHLTLLGWVGLTVLGTMLTLWPTTLRARIGPDTHAAARRALPVLCAGLALTAAGMLAAVVWLTAAGLLCYAVGVGVVAVPLVRSAVGRRPQGPAAWMLGAATGWLAAAVVYEAGRLLVAGSVQALPAVTAETLPILIVGFTVQVLMGALTQLLPMLVGRGPAEHKAVAELLSAGWPARVAAINVAVPLVAGNWPDPLPLLGWVLAAAAVATFVVQALRVALPMARRGSISAQRQRIPGTGTGVVAGLAVVVLAVAVAATGHDAPTATLASGPTRTVDVTLQAMRMNPDVVEVAAGTRLVLRVTNVDAMPHDLRVETGEKTPVLGQGETATLDLGVIDGPRQAWCTVAGHRAAGMTMTIRTDGGATASTHDTHSPGDMGAAMPAALDLGADPSPGWTPRDARLQPVAGTVHKIELTVAERDVEVAPGRFERRWTFGGSAPGPTLHGRVGDQFEITLVNDGTMGHSIDFHAGMLAPDVPMRTIAPGERLTYRFTAHHAGAWLYHCSTMPMALHIANGMFGAVIIDPPGLAPVDREYVLVSSQLYLGEPGSQTQTDNLRAGQPDGWAFNGMAAQYDHAPLTAVVGERARIWVVNAGPGDSTAFHVVGGQFDTVYSEGAWLLRPSVGTEKTGAAQVLNLAPAQGGFVELTFPEAGNYPFVDHDMRHGENGAHGVIAVAG